MCKLQEPPFEMDIVVSSNVEDIMALASKPKEKKTKKAKKTTGMEVVESVQEAPEPQVIVNENAQSAFENVALPTYEEMMFQDWLACGNVEPPVDLPADLEQVALQEYLLDASKPLHTHFILPHQGKRSTCPVYFGNADNKETVLNTKCNEMHAKIQQQWEPLPVTVDWSLPSSSVKPQEIQTKCSYAVLRPERQGVVIFSASTSHPNPTMSLKLLHHLPSRND